MIFNGCKILVVDDTEDVRNTVAGVLKDAGYFAQTAADEIEAIEILRADTFHFIVIDIRLQGDADEDESGLELAKTIREHGIQSKIIFVTGKAVKGSYFDSLLEYGVLKCIEKKDNGWMDTVKETIKHNFLKFDVFLCHNSKDKPAVKRIGKELEFRGLRPWLDEWELPPGLPWQPQVEQQISDIKSAAVFVGKDGIGPWQNMEVRVLLSQFVQRGYPVIPVILENAPQQPDLPLFLSEMTWVDFRKSEPDPMRQLIWGITGKK